MASVLPYPKKPGWWRAQVVRKGIRRTRIFPSKGAADAWARRNEEAILSGDITPPNLRVSDLLARYAREFSPDKKGARWELIRLEALGRDRIAQVRLRDLAPPHASYWQQRRLQAVSGASVRRERNLLNNALEIARKEWGWVRTNPFEGVRRPKDGLPKERVASGGEVDLILEAASPAMQRVIVFALETGMRAGEIASLKVEDLRGNVAVLRDTKNGTSREVPLSEKAQRVIVEASTNSNAQISRARPTAWISAATDGVPGKVLRQDESEASGSCAPPPTIFGLTAGTISTRFRELCKEVGIKGLSFHCLRRTAATRLSKKLDVWQLCAMFGWRDPKIPMKHYYKSDAAEIAARLDEGNGL